MRVLIVEDELLIRWSIGQTLSHGGHMVLEAADARSAIAAIQNCAECIDVVLLDYRLPDSNDLSLLANICRLSPRSAIILMTAYGTPEVTRGALELGAYTVISKPFEMQDLDGLISRASSRLSH